MLVNPGGQIVQRNRAADELAARVVAARGAEILGALRDQLTKVVRETRVFPVTRLVRVEANGQHAEAEFITNKVGDGFVVTWSDITETYDTNRATKSMAAELSASSESLIALAEKIAAGAEAVSTRAAAVAAGSEQMSTSISEIALSASSATASTNTAVDAAAVAGERLAKLSESSTKIGAVSKLITAIAGQTNLLALNATIEAARAGSAGKGFAVVAGEVKGLAGSTQNATGEITEMISAIQADSVAASNAIAEIMRLIDEIGAQQTTVAGAVEEQTAVASEMSASVAGVAESAEVSARAVDELRAAADFVAGKSIELNALFAAS
jgi:methyl-accepting chemotaxis protein